MSRTRDPFDVAADSGVPLVAAVVVAVAFAGGLGGCGCPPRPDGTPAATQSGALAPEAAPAPGPRAAAPATVEAVAPPTTTLHRYQPTLAVAPGPLSSDNDCWTSSIASSRADAFRCMTGNRIHDPCFSFRRPEDTPPMGVMVCPYDPRVASDDVAFAYDLSRLQPPQGAMDTPWFMVVDGDPCPVMTGTIGSVGDVSVPFACGPTGQRLCSLPEGTDSVTARCGAETDSSLRTRFVSELWR